MRFVPFAVAALLACAALPASAQDAPTFRTGVSLVHVDAEAVDAAGRIVSGLHKEDFRVFDERREQPILQFFAGEEPLDLILLFDVSGSMRPMIQVVATAAREGLTELRPGDRVCVMVFNSRSFEITSFTSDLDAVARTIRDGVLTLPFGGGTHIQSALSDAAIRLRQEPRSRRQRAALIVTDDIGQRTQSDESVVREFWESDAILSGLIVSGKVYHAFLDPESLDMRAGMKGIAKKTGGDALTANDPGPAFQQAMRRIRTRYSLYYALPDAKPGTRRSIKVELTSAAAQRFPKARVRARTGYLAPQVEGRPE